MPFTVFITFICSRKWLQNSGPFLGCKGHIFSLAFSLPPNVLGLDVLEDAGECFNAL